MCYTTLTCIYGINVKIFPNYQYKQSLLVHVMISYCPAKLLILWLKTGSLLFCQTCAVLPLPTCCLWCFRSVLIPLQAFAACFLLNYFWDMIGLFLVYHITLKGNVLYLFYFLLLSSHIGTERCFAVVSSFEYLSKYICRFYHCSKDHKCNFLNFGLCGGCLLDADIKRSVSSSGRSFLSSESM